MCPSYTRGAWISSENTRPPCRSTTSATASISVGLEHAPDRVVRVAEHQQAAARGEGRVQRVEVVDGALAVAGHRHLDDRAAHPRRDGEEGHVRRRGQDDRRVGGGEEVDRGGEAGDHVGERSDPLGRHVPAVARPREAGPRLAQPAGQRVGQVAEQAPVDGVPDRVQHRGSGAEVHLRDERADGVRVLRPLEPADRTQLLDRDVVEPVGHRVLLCGCAAGKVTVRRAARTVAGRPSA